MIYGEQGYLQPPSVEARSDRISFFEEYQPELRKLFDVLGMQDQWSEDLEQVVKVTQGLVKGDHAQPVNSISLEGEQALEARELFRAMGLVDVCELPGGQVDQALLLGAEQRANRVRFGFLGAIMQRPDIKITDDGLIILGGHRGVNEKRELPYITETLRALNHPRHPARTDTWLERIKTTGPRSETDLLRLTAMHELGDLTLKGPYLKLGTLDPISHYRFDQDGKQVTLIHTHAVSRGQNTPRHTTRECAKDWLRYAAPPRGAQVAIVANQPHVRRTTQEIQNVLDEQGRTDVRLIGCGPAAYDDPGKYYLFLGEIGRLLYMDGQRLG